MTIKIENEALLCVSNSVESSKQLHRSQPASPKSPSSEGVSSDYILCFSDHDASLSEYSVPPGAIELDDDELTTASSCSSVSTTYSSESSGRRVSWRGCVVSEIRTRPRTPPQDVSTLFYSSEETDEFRRQYRRERELEAERERETTSQSTSPEPKRRRHISRVVVLHNDTKETYFSEDRSVEGSNYFSPNNNISLSDNKDEAFFDNDNFWSGSITWY